MFVIQCPECMTRFKVSEEALGDGKDVRCGECQHVWFQTPPDGDDISVEGGTTKPVIHENTFDEELAEAVVDVPDAIAPDTGSDALTIEDEEGKVISTKTAVTVFASLLIITIGVLVALQPHQATVFFSVICTILGVIPTEPCDPSQNGCFFETPHVHQA